MSSSASVRDQTSMGKAFERIWTRPGRSNATGARGLSSVPAVMMYSNVIVSCLTVEALLVDPENTHPLILASAADFNSGCPDPLTEITLPSAAIVRSSVTVP